MRVTVKTGDYFVLLNGTAMVNLSYSTTLQIHVVLGTSSIYKLVVFINNNIYLAALNILIFVKSGLKKKV